MMTNGKTMFDTTNHIAILPAGRKASVVCNWSGELKNSED